MGKAHGLRNAGVCGVVSRKDRLLTPIGVFNAQRWRVTVSFMGIDTGNVLVR